MSFHIVLVTPEIAGNTGNIGRTCVATGTKLHLIRPLGFVINDKTLKRAGMDYWKHVDLEIHDSLEEFLEKYKGNRMFLATTKGGKNYCQYAYEDGDMMLFGAESKGLPEKFIEANKAMAIRIPMSGAAEFRSLNLANCANIILFEALRQNGFQGLK